MLQSLDLLRESMGLTKTGIEYDTWNGYEDRVIPDPSRRKQQQEEEEEEEQDELKQDGVNRLLGGNISSQVAIWSPELGGKWKESPRKP